MRLLATALAFALLLPTPLVAGQRYTDEVVGLRAAQAIRTYSRFTIFDDVTVHVEDQHVTLTGRVTIPLKKEEIGARVQGVDGVKSVSNEIGVLPASPTDDRLRRAVAAAIYNHPVFWLYAESAHPSIHIVIENARVTLTGEVDRRGDSLLAQSLAHVPGVLSVENRLRVAER
jgi:hyperosmotically inducible protein